MEAKPDTAGVIAPPPLIALSTLVLGILIQFLAPSSGVAVIPDWLRHFLAAALILMGCALIWRANRSFIAAGTPAPPWRPSTTLVTGDVFAHVRNPMYFGGGLLLFGIGLLIADDWLILMTMISMIIIHFGVILREERYLDAKFGEVYRSYKARVPRYGWRP